MAYKDELWCTEDSPASIDPTVGKVDEPYAQLIYKAFMSTPNQSMTLQEIYQWFRQNTEKAKSEGKGWQNSIRHNLSMNGVRFSSINMICFLEGARDIEEHSHLTLNTRIGIHQA